MYFLKKYRRGIFNKYRKGMPVPEMLLKDLSHFFLQVRNYIKNGFRQKNMLVYPHYPSRGSTIYKIGKILGMNVTNKPAKKTHIAVYWEYLTYREEYRYLESLAGKIKVINLFNRDISKVLVDKVQQKVFGYSTFIDPLNYKGKIVRKNNINAKHDGVVLEGPLKEADQDEYIYQILIDNSVPGGRVVDIRVPVVGQVLDFVYIKYRYISDRFKNPIQTEVKPATDILSSEEMGLLNAFCREMHVEYGELDVLRHNENSRLYVIDVNNTPQGPPENTSSADGKYALKRMAEAFEKKFL